MQIDQHNSIFNFNPLFLLILQIRVMLNVFVKVTIGIGELIHISNAEARVVSWGFISLIAVNF